MSHLKLETLSNQFNLLPNQKYLQKLKIRRMMMNLGILSNRLNSQSSKDLHKLILANYKNSIKNWLNNLCPDCQITPLQNGNISWNDAAYI